MTDDRGWMRPTNPSSIIRPPTSVSLAGWIHRCELTAVEDEHPPREAAVARDPGADVLRIDFHQQLRAAATGDGPAVFARVPGRMEAEPRAVRDADAITRDHAE